VTGTLYLIPVPLGPVSPETCLPPDTLAVARRLDHFVVERAKTARAHLKAMGHPRPIQALQLSELNEHTPAAAIPPLLAPLKAGHDVGLLSEAGCPAVADPGAALVMAAHRAAIRVVPPVSVLPSTATCPPRSPSAARPSANWKKPRAATRRRNCSSKRPTAAQPCLTHWPQPCRREPSSASARISACRAS